MWSPRSEKLVWSNKSSPDDLIFNDNYPCDGVFLLWVYFPLLLLDVVNKGLELSEERKFNTFITDYIDSRLLFTRVPGMLLLFSVKGNVGENLCFAFGLCHKWNLPISLIFSLRMFSCFINSSPFSSDISIFFGSYKTEQTKKFAVTFYFFFTNLGT